jgi:twitching motility protein PilT
MQTFDQSILQLYQKHMISYETAMENATNPNDLEMEIRGIKSSSSRLSDAVQ